MEMIEKFKEKALNRYKLETIDKKDATRLSNTLQLARWSEAKGLTCRLEKVIKKNQLINNLKKDKYRVVRRPQDTTRHLHGPLGIGRHYSVADNPFVRLGHTGKGHQVCLYMEPFENYSNAIPDDILERVAEEMGNFKRFEVWSIRLEKEIRKECKSKDPLLIGVAEGEVCAILGVWDDNDLEIFEKLGW